MKKKSTSQSAPARRSLGEGGFFNLRVLLASVLCLAGIFVALLGVGAFSSVFAQAKGAKNNRSSTQDAPGTQTPEVVRMVGPAVVTNLRDLPYVAPAPQIIKQRLTLHPQSETEAPEQEYPSFQSVLEGISQAIPNMPPPLLTFDGINFSTSGCGCYPPDTNGDVGPNHYVQTVNIGFRVYDKSGNPLAPFTTYQSFFAALTGTPCSGHNQGDPFVFYDQVANRWVVSDFAFASFPGTNFYECIGVSQGPDPTLGYNLYALLVDATNLDDYPKLAMWNNPTPGGAYHLTVNLFLNGTTFTGVKVFALDRGSMLSGGPANAIGFTIPYPAGVGDSYSLVPGGFRTGNPPPAGRDEFLLAVDAQLPGVTLTHVHGWLFHVDFVTPANSTIGLGPNHTPNADITVNPFVQAWTATTYNLVPQQGTAQKLDTIGDKIMTPVVYQFRNGVESLWADQTTMLNFPNGPTVVTWYQFDVTGGTFPATAAQQQDWSNGNDGLWRWMPSIAVDNSGNTAIGYSTSSPSIFAGIRYAGRLAADPPNNLGQGEAVMTNGGGFQSGTAGRWGDYSMTTLDTDGMTFWHTNEYYPNSASVNWFTRVGKFQFPTGLPCTQGWSAGGAFPSVGVRSVGVFFPSNGNFYAMGGRSSDSAGSDFTHPFEYNTNTNTWATKAATFMDNTVNNMACGALSLGGVPYIYCVGGSPAGGATATARVFYYNPANDSLTYLPGGDNWPGDSSGTILPGGFAVYNNKLYILGGFDINIASTNQIWEFDPTQAVGSKWLQRVNTPMGVMYAPTCTIGGGIYLAGASDFSGGTVIDTTNSFKFDPVANTTSSIAAIPRATGETRALTFNGKMLVMGGGRVAPNPSNEVDAYDPVANSWTVNAPVPAFVNARRNFATDTNGTDHIWLAGGYAPASPTDSTEVFCSGAPPSPTPTATATPTAAATATPTATATATATPTPTPTPTPRATPTPRPQPTPRPRP